MRGIVTAIALVTGLPQWTAAREAGSATLAAGARVRVTAAESFTIPGVAVVGRNRIEGAFETRDAEAVTTRDRDGRLLTLPLPDIQLSGTLMSEDEATINILRPGGEDPLVIPRAAIARLDVRRPGMKKSVAKGIVLGFLGGLAVGAAYGFVGHPPFDHAYEASVGEEALGYGLVFSLPGMLIGGTMGAGRDGGWREVPVDSHIRVGLGAHVGSAGVRVAVSW
jgi:hypothetical protein